MWKIGEIVFQIHIFPAYGSVDCMKNIMEKKRYNRKSTKIFVSVCTSIVIVRLYLQGVSGYVAKYFFLKFLLLLK